MAVRPLLFTQTPVCTIIAGYLMDASSFLWKSRQPSLLCEEAATFGRSGLTATRVRPPVGRERSPIGRVFRLTNLVLQRTAGVWSSLGIQVSLLHWLVN